MTTQQKQIIKQARKLKELCQEQGVTSLFLVDIPNQNGDFQLMGQGSVETTMMMLEAGLPKIMAGYNIQNN